LINQIFGDNLKLTINILIYNFRDKISV